MDVIVPWSYFRFLEASKCFHVLLPLTLTHAEKMDMLLVEAKVLDCLPASQTLNKFSLCTVSVCVCVYLTICTSMCMCAKCSINKRRYHYCNVTVITANIQVQHPERERVQAANRGYFTVDRCICTCVYDRRKQIMWEQGKLHVNFLVSQVFFPLRFLSAEMHTLVMGLDSVCACVCEWTIVW